MQYMNGLLKKNKDEKDLNAAARLYLHKN